MLDIDMLPKRFPEYSIMHNTILKQIKKLEEIKCDSPEKVNEIQIKIQRYQIELCRIEKMFPEEFFEKKTNQ